VGTWGFDNFDNDHACDFAHEIEKSKDLSLVEDAIDRVLAVRNGELHSPDAEEALVAAEVVARLLGRFGARNAYTEGIDAWVAAKKFRPSPDLISKAVAAIDRILIPPSEILELWEDTDEAAEWKACVGALRSRLTG
jgi:hypothetical protein